MLMIPLWTLCQTVSSHPTDSTKICIDRSSFKNILSAAYDNDECRINLRSCELKLVDAKRKIDKKNTYIKIITTLTLILTVGVIYK